MPLALPNLDDRTYADLVDEAFSLIPTYAPEWTNRNPSDPGITLIELFAYLTEMLIYRLNRVPPDNVRAFLRLLNGPKPQPSVQDLIQSLLAVHFAGILPHKPDSKPSDQKTLADEIRESVAALRRPDRAVTAADFERLAREADSRVARSRCLPRRDLTPGDLASRSKEKAGHVSVVIVPKKADGITGVPSKELIGKVSAYLDERRMLATKVHVVGPCYVRVRVEATLHLKPDAEEDKVRESALEALRRFLDPLKGGESGEGWPFGRNIYVSEIYNLLGQVPGVDYVSDDSVKLALPDQAGRELKWPGIQGLLAPGTGGRSAAPEAEGKLVGILLHPDELVGPDEPRDCEIKVQLPWETYP
jgi:hypothetical protein